MTALILYYNGNCGDCRRKARLTTRLDWFGQVDPSTNLSPVGEVPVGQIVVVDKRRSRVFTGIHATRKLCLHVPAFVLLGLLLYIPPIRRIAEKRQEKQNGCNSDECQI